MTDPNTAPTKLEATSKFNTCSSINLSYLPAVRLVKLLPYNEIVSFRRSLVHLPLVPYFKP